MSIFWLKGHDTSSRCMIIKADVGVSVRQLKSLTFFYTTDTPV